LGNARIGPDIMAGITLAALGIPEVMGYTKIIGMPVITGLYTLFLPVLVFALFGSSRHLVVSADSATAAMVVAALVSLSFTAYTPRYVEHSSHSWRLLSFSSPEYFAWASSPIFFPAQS
jgi:MFS superfamily sulfate permease-like transporter